MKDIAKKALDKVLELGAQHAQCRISEKDMSELNTEFGEFTLLRSNREYSLSLKVVKDGKAGSVTTDRIDDQGINEAADQVLVLADSSESDEANAISPACEPQQFESIQEYAGPELLYEQLDKFTTSVKSRFPKINMRRAIMKYTESDSVYINSNGVDLSEKTGSYFFNAMFVAREGKKQSSFNGIAFHLSDPRKSLMETCELETLLEQTVNQLDPIALTSKFTGPVIVTPFCLSSFLWSYERHFLANSSLISGTSPLKDKMGQKVASDCFTFASSPAHPDFAHKSMITADGFVADDSVMIENGILKQFSLDLYGANKTGHPRAGNCEGKYVVEPGDEQLADMIKGIDKGILLCRFSSGMPGKSGDFAGVAKNSFLIENGKVGPAIKETMVSSNLREMFANISSISKERLNMGYSLQPWIKFEGMTISGK